MDLHRPTAWLVMYRRVDERPDLNVVYEGEVPLSNPDPLKQLIGDGNASLTISKDRAHKDYGRGGSVFVSVTLKCDQSQPFLDAAEKWASSTVDKYLDEEYEVLKQQLLKLGIA